jgi:hypothetical protein
LDLSDVKEDILKIDKDSTIQYKGDYYKLDRKYLRHKFEDIKDNLESMSSKGDAKFFLLDINNLQDLNSMNSDVCKYCNLYKIGGFNSV